MIKYALKITIRQLRPSCVARKVDGRKRVYQGFRVMASAGTRERGLKSTSLGCWANEKIGHLQRPGD